MSEKEFDELIKVASSDIFDEDFDLDENTESVEVSHRHKIRMNRIFRERVGGKFLPYPEVDNLFEKARSWVVIKLHLVKQARP